MNGFHLPQGYRATTRRQFSFYRQQINQSIAIQEKREDLHLLQHNVNLLPLSNKISI